MQAYISSILQVPEFRRVLSLSGLTPLTRLVNKDFANAIQDSAIRIILQPGFQLTEADITGLSLKLANAGVRLPSLCIKITPRDVSGECDTALLMFVISAIRPHASVITYLIMKGASNIDLCLPHMFSMSDRLTHLNVASQTSTAEFWKCLPSTLVSLRCSISTPPSQDTPTLASLRAVSDHGVQQLGISTIDAILHIAPMLNKLVRKEVQLYGITEAEAGDVATAPAMFRLEERIRGGLFTDHVGGQNYNIGLSYSAMNDTLTPLLLVVQPMTFVLNVTLMHLNNCPHRASTLNKILHAFPNASVKVVQ